MRTRSGLCGQRSARTAALSPDRPGGRDGATLRPRRWSRPRPTDSGSGGYVWLIGHRSRWPLQRRGGQQHGRQAACGQGERAHQPHRRMAMSVRQEPIPGRARRGQDRGRGGQRDSGPADMTLTSRENPGSRFQAGFADVQQFRANDHRLVHKGSPAARTNCPATRSPPGPAGPFRPPCYIVASMIRTLSRFRHDGQEPPGRLQHVGVTGERQRHRPGGGGAGVERVAVEGRGGAGGGLNATAVQPGTVASCHSPPLRLRLLPKAWPGKVSPT